MKLLSSQEYTEEPSRFWALVIRFAFVGCLLLLFGGLGIMLLPQLKSLRTTDARIADLKSQEAILQKKKEKLDRTSILLLGDEHFIEYKARDILDLKKPDEVIFRFQD